MSEYDEIQDEQPEAYEDDGSLFDINTAIKEPLKWRLNGTTRILKTLDHLSPEEETKLKWLFKKMADADRRFTACKTSEAQKAQGIMQTIEGYQNEIVTIITDLSKAEAATLNSKAKATVMRHFTAGSEEDEGAETPAA